MKTFIRPRFAWPVAERLIRRATGSGRLPLEPDVTRTVSRHVRCETIVVGAGIAGLSAALDAAAQGEHVLLCDEFAIGSRVPPGADPRLDPLARDPGARAPGASRSSKATRRSGSSTDRWCRSRAVGELVQVHPQRVVVATGATETHQLFPGNDLPGVWLGRAAASMAGAARRAARPAGGRGRLHGRRARAPARARRRGDARGSGGRAVGLPRRGPGTGRGDRGRRVDRGAGTGARAVGRGSRASGNAAGSRATRSCSRPGSRRGTSWRGWRPANPSGSSATRRADPDDPRLADGIVCLCEDVSLHDLEQAWAEGFRSAELLKRYTTATMGPCRGATCGRALACFARDRAGEPAGTRTTSRPPLRPVTLETLAASVHEVVEKRTGLHDVHVAAGATLGWSSGWKRPVAYGDLAEEYRAVRERVGLMDVGTLGRFLIAGRDAAALADALFPGRVDGSRTGPVALRARARRGRVRRGRRAALRARGRLVPPHLDLGRSRAHGRSSARVGRSPGPARAPARPHVRARGDPGRRAAGPRPARTPIRRSDRRRHAPVPRTRGDHGGRRPLPSDPQRVRRRARVRAAPSPLPRTRAVGRPATGGRRPRDLAVRPADPRGPPPGEGPRLPRAGRDARRHAGQARAGLGRRPDQAVVRRQGRARTTRRDADDPAAGRARVRRCARPTPRSSAGRPSPSQARSSAG